MIEMEQEAATKKSDHKKPGLILMCAGDGVNDAPALKLGAGAARNGNSRCDPFGLKPL